VTTFAIISDLHANLEAVEAVLQRIDQLGVRETVCLGDVVGYGADPGPTTRLVVERCKWTIQGNHDWGLFHSLEEFNPLAREALSSRGAGSSRPCSRPAAASSGSSCAICRTAARTTATCSSTARRAIP
jgi:hypothetical protein